MAILRSEAIADAIARRGWRLGFMPHPNLQAVLQQLDLPPHVEPLTFRGTDVQALYARAVLLVTDYSSVAFNMAYLDRPVVYFQFDRAEMERGAHMGRKGYFEYERDGFGPVVEDVPAAEAAIVAAVEHAPTPAPEYQARIDATFPVRDGGASERVVAAVEELSRPHPLTLPQPPESAQPEEGGP
jgi:CDP-glycerol glycerophosphotransferase (TagB/SpsB family)